MTFEDFEFEVSDIESKYKQMKVLTERYTIPVEVVQFRLSIVFVFNHTSVAIYDNGMWTLFFLKEHKQMPHNKFVQSVTAMLDQKQLEHDNPKMFKKKS